VERKLLETKGYEVSVAVDGMDGWNSLQGGSFDLVVSDIDMPRMNGIELVRKIKTDPLLKGRLRLVFVSVDPVRDTPSVLRMLETQERGGDVPWVFLTGASEAEMTPLLAAMGQDIAHETDRAGKRTGTINHMLKVFLIDPEGWVREIYSTAFLTPEGLLNDLRTLAMEFPHANNRLSEQ
jgi:CheY-like chemotaxis protein